MRQLFGRNIGTIEIQSIICNTEQRFRIDTNIFCGLLLVSFYSFAQRINEIEKMKSSDSARLYTTQDVSWTSNFLQKPRTHDEALQFFGNVVGDDKQRLVTKSQTETRYGRTHVERNSR